MTRKIVLAGLAGGACLLVTVGAFADELKDKSASSQSFASLDRNGDRRISRSEAGFDAKLSQTFAELDTDGDGFVSAAEFSAGEKKRATASTFTPQ